MCVPECFVSRCSQIKFVHKRRCAINAEATRTELITIAGYIVEGAVAPGIRSVGLELDVVAVVPLRFQAVYTSPVHGEALGDRLAEFNSVGLRVLQSFTAGNPLAPGPVSVDMAKSQLVRGAEIPWVVSSNMT